MFRELLGEGALVDAFRAKNSDVDIEGPNFSYRGAAGDGGRGRYYGKGMRIDHALVSVKLGVAACELLGRGAERVGFMGSDHCPLRLVLGGGGEGSPAEEQSDESFERKRNPEQGSDGAGGSATVVKPRTWGVEVAPKSVSVAIGR